MSNGKISEIIDLKEGMAFLEELNRLSKAIEDLRKKVLKAMPAKYGSDLWWEKSDARALEEIKKGNYIKISTKEELKKFLGL